MGILKVDNNNIQQSSNNGGKTTFRVKMKNLTSKNEEVQNVRIQDAKTTIKVTDSGKSNRRKILLIIAAIVGLITFLMGEWAIYLVFGDSTFTIEGTIYTTINAILFAMMLNILGFVRTAKFRTRVIRTIIIGVIALLGAGVLTFGFYIKRLNVTTYMLNENPAEFMIGNALFLLTLYVLSFNLEGEQRYD